MVATVARFGVGCTTESQASVARASNFSQEAGNPELCVWNLLTPSPRALWYTLDLPGAKSSHGVPFGDRWLVHIGIRQIYLCLEIQPPARAQISP